MSKRDLFSVMFVFGLSAVLVLSVAGAFAWGDAAPGKPQADKAPPPPATPDVDPWLDKLEARSEALQSLRAKVTYTRVQGLLGDKQIRVGTVAYDAGEQRRFRVVFNRMLLGGKVKQIDRRFIFDGRWLAEVDGDEKIWNLYELVAEGERGRDLLSLADGPLPMPVVIRKDEILRSFKVALIEQPEGEDGALHLRLVPRSPERADVERVDIWFDGRTLLPTKVEAIDDAASQTRSIILLREMETDAELKDELFNTAPPKDGKWQVQIERLEKERAAEQGRGD